MSKKAQFLIAMVSVSALVLAFILDQNSNVVAAAPQQKEESKPSAEQRNLDLEYAKAYLELVQNEVKRVEATNKRVSDTVPTLVLDELYDTLTFAEARVKAVEDPAHAVEDFEQALKKISERARQRIEQAEKANRISPGTFSQTEMQRMKVMARLAELRVERVKQLEGASLDDRLDWEVEQLREQVDRLRIVTATLISRE